MLTDKCRIKTHLIRTELLYEKTKEKGKKNCKQFPSEVLTDKQMAKRNELQNHKYLSGRELIYSNKPEKEAFGLSAAEQ